MYSLMENINLMDTSAEFAFLMAHDDIIYYKYNYAVLVQVIIIEEIYIEREQYLSHQEG